MKDNPPEKTAMWLFFILGIFGLFIFAIQDLVRSDIPWTQAKERIAQGDVELIEIDGEMVKIHLDHYDSCHRELSPLFYLLHHYQNQVS